MSKQTPALVSAWPHVSHEMTRPGPCRIMSRAALYQWYQANGTLSLFFALYGPGQFYDGVLEKAGCTLSAFYITFPSAMGEAYDGQRRD